MGTAVAILFLIVGTVGLLPWATAFGWATILITIVGYLFNYLAKHNIDFILQKFKESVEKPIQSDWSIRILHPNKRIERCMIFYDNTPLPWWDSLEQCVYEHFLFVGGGGNVRISKGNEKDDIEVKITDGSKILKKMKFNEIPIIQP